MPQPSRSHFYHGQQEVYQDTREQNGSAPGGAMGE
jgi:hypothetical protein